MKKEWIEWLSFETSRIGSGAELSFGQMMAHKKAFES